MYTINNNIAILFSLGGERIALTFRGEIFVSLPLSLLYIIFFGKFARIKYTKHNTERGSHHN